MNILRACLAAGFLVATAASTVRADDALRRYQQSLRNQGFYYGPIDGNPGDETTQALRRFHAKASASRRKNRQGGRVIIACVVGRVR